MAKFEITLRKNKEFQFNLKTSNGQTILSSEGYARKANCIKGIESVKVNSEEDKRFDRKKSKSNKFYFNLKSINGKVIGTSEMYESERAMENGIKSVKTNAKGASVDYKPEK